MKKALNKKGFTLIELVVIVAIIGVLASVIVPSITNYSTRAKKSTAQYNGSIVLNSASQITARINNGENIELSSETLSAETNMNVSLGTEAIDNSVVVKVKNNEVTKIWSMVKGKLAVWTKQYGWTDEDMVEEEEEESLTPLGNSFEDITAAMIRLIRERYASEGSYGRSWDDYRYLDIGLNPEDWANPINGIYYKPSGSNLLITPMVGCTIYVNDVEGNLRTLKGSYNWNLIYSDLDGNWYYHSISPENLIDITTKEIVCS